DALHFGDRLARYNEQAAHALFCGDGQVRQDHQIVDALKFDGRNDGYIRATITQIIGALRRYGKRKIVFIVESTSSKTVHQWGGIQVLHDRDAKFSHKGWP